MEKLYTVSKNRLGADCGSDHELIAKFRLKLKKVRKITRPFRYDLNQIPSHYTEEGVVLCPSSLATIPSQIMVRYNQEFNMYHLEFECCKDCC